MSRTYAHVLIQIRVARGDVGRIEVHGHTDGLCDLPDPYDRSTWRRGPGHCCWMWVHDGHGLCPCEMCHHGKQNRRERRADRQRVRRQLRIATLDSEAAEDF